MKMKFAFVALLAMFAFSGCSDDDGEYKCSSCADEPEALAANDDSGRGIYKGVLIGSTGTIKIDIDNHGEGHYSAVLTIDGDEFELTTEGTYNSEGGFQGCFENTAADISICFSVSAEGGEWGIIDYSIPGHDDLIVSLYKEFSNQLVEVYEGTYSGDASGTFNMVVLRDADDDDNGYWTAISRSDELEYVDSYFEGYIEDDELFGGSGEIAVGGELNDDTVKGAWEAVGGSDSGTWKGKRTL
ncbi:MAG: hypothetical protein WAZ98_01930 [Cyclobacteriaceae bacterium]